MKNYAPLLFMQAKGRGEYGKRKRIMENLKFEVEALEPMKKKITVEVPSEEVVRYVNTEFDEISKTAKLSGFRPGKIPREILQQRYGGKILSGAAEKLIEKSFPEVLKLEKLVPADKPSFEITQISETTPLKYFATLYVRPRPTIEGYKDLKLEKRKSEVSEEEVDSNLIKLLDGQADFKAVNREADDGDMAILDFTGDIDGKPIPEGKGTNQPIIVGDTIIPGFDTALKGKRAGDELDVDTEFPGDYYDKSLAGKPAHFSISVKEIRERRVPAMDNDFAKLFGTATMAELKKRVNDELVQGKEIQEEQRLKGEAIDVLIEQNPFVIPDVMVKKYYEGIMKSVTKMNEESGNPKVMDMTEETMEKYKEIAVTHAKRDIILDAVAEQEKVIVGTADMDAAAKKMAAPKGEDPDRLIARLAREGSLSMFIDGLKDEKVFDILLERPGLAEAGTEARAEKA